MSKLSNLIFFVIVCIIISKSSTYLDDEIVQVMELMPKWTPGINEEKIVDSYFLMDIRLK